MNVFFGIVWDCIGLTSYNGPDKLIDQCWRIFSTRTESHHYPYGWLAGWLAGNQTKTPSKRNISLSVAELKVHEKNIQKRRRQAGGYKS